MTVLDLAALAGSHGRSIAVYGAEGGVSYAALAERVAGRARALADAGVGPGARAALGCGADLATLVDALALLSLDCAVMPVSSAILSDEAERLNTLFAAAWHVRGAEIRRLPAATGEPPPSGIALALPSSGSTGRPKLVLKTAAQVRAAVDFYARSVALAPDDRVVAAVPFEHSYGFVNVLLGTIARGAAIVLPAAPHPRAVANDARRFGASLLAGAPHFFDLTMRFEGPGGSPLPLRAAISVGSGLSRRTHDAFTAAFRLPLWQSYGASEAGPVSLNTTGAIDDDAESAPGGGAMALGRPCDGVDVEILDERGAPLPEGAAGEIVVRSPTVAEAYLEEPASAATGSVAADTDGTSRLDGGRFFSGDLGAIRDGVLRFRGRRKLLIAAAGRKVDPQEVEAVLLAHDRIEDAAVVAQIEPDGREVVKAIVVPRAPLETLDVTDFCARRLAPHKVPRVVEFRASLPRTALGKLLRDRL